MGCIAYLHVWRQCHAMATPMNFPWASQHLHVCTLSVASLSKGKRLTWTAQDSVSGDGDEEGALSNFLPAVIPARPSDLELQDSGLQVAQVHHSSRYGSSTCSHCSCTCSLQPVKQLCTMSPHHYPVLVTIRVWLKMLAYMLSVSIQAMLLMYALQSKSLLWNDNGV